MNTTPRPIAMMALLTLTAGSFGQTPPMPIQPAPQPSPCTRCAGWILPGKLEPIPEHPYRIDSDLPEMFTSLGVLYSTRATLPPLRAKSGEPVPESQRKQRNLGFRTIDAGFEVFLYHLSYAGDGPRDRRLTVYVTNRGSATVTVRPSQIIEARGTMATFDGPESRLAVRTLQGQWDHPVPEVRIPPAAGRVIAWTPRISDTQAPSGDADRFTEDFVTGIVRAQVSSPAAADLEVAVIAVAGDTPVEALTDASKALLDVGANSAETMDLSILPPECHVRRVSGVSRNFLWRSADTLIDLSSLPNTPLMLKDGKGASHAGPPGIGLLMTAPRVQTVDCPDARQTGDMLLHPGYVHPETIGNYQVEYLVNLTLSNPTDSPRSIDLRFGKHDADIGLAWQIAIGSTYATGDALKALPAHVQWAGAWRKDDLPDNTRSFLAPLKHADDTTARPGSLTVQARSRVCVSLRFVPVGTSSMPFMLHAVPAEPAAVPR
ncbi:MAG: hypothetical protein ACK51N_04365 [bacterium]|jgi:hypothetical protein|nr:hypothetical protein [Planctomycetaceae bacterium]